MKMSGEKVVMRRCRRGHEMPGLTTYPRRSQTSTARPCIPYSKRRLWNPSRRGKACPTPEIEEQPLAADPETPEYGPNDYGPPMPEMADESYERNGRSNNARKTGNTFCEKCKKWGHPEENCWQDIKRCTDRGEIHPGIQCVEWRAFKTVKHLASQGMLNDSVPSQTLAQLQTKDTGQGKQ
ncbi:LOW QUALITY PROTEIN: hypothetical protein PHMEG_00023276 [Phytophthora megakarya]|uniref:Uncharacterized protein n=1 Tax=Phytophthora megakarya TaxID=4795 RepID=A0A225VGS0_9STRA|nr:LOW QUALITY PROTEIN: hypothetical protein PHMEG_00023276 [Phytophthora megakarya]